MFILLKLGRLVRYFFAFNAVLLLLLGSTNALFAQIVRINELMSSNQSFLEDADGDYSDWFELYNENTASINLSGYSINDRNDTLTAWHFPNISIDPNAYLMLFASGKDQNTITNFWRTVIDQGDEWRYLVPDMEPDINWKYTNYDDSRWQTGKSGFGYGDNDDATVIPNIQSILLRKSFTIDDVNNVKEAVLHMDYDDGFVAYLNGVEIARSNITSVGPPAYNASADNSTHEALIFQGGVPETFAIDFTEGLLKTGKNVLAVQVHNAGTNSSDLSAIPFLSIAFNTYVEGDANTMFQFPQHKLHTNFKLSANGETLYLFKQGNLVDSLQFPEVRANVSYGRDAGTPSQTGFFATPTPEAENEKMYTSIPGEVYFSQASGIIKEHFNLRLTTDQPNDKIYYTTDGTIPTISANLYTEPIAINETTMLRASIINDNSFPGLVYTRDYYFNVQHDIPIISLVTDPDNFFDDLIGIYVDGSVRHPVSGQDCDNGENFWQDWERPVHISMINPDGSLAFEQDAGVKIFGGCSRRFNQKSLSLRFRKEYGKSKLKYKMFDDLDIDEFTSLNLRNSGNDWNQTMIRDGLQSHLFPENIDKQAFRPSVVYINGEYWGIHNIRERIDDEFIEAHHNVDNKTVNMMEFHVNWRLNEIRGDGQSYLDLLDFIENNDLTIQENFEVVRNTIDIKNFAMYQACNIALKNTDWPGNNVKFWNSEEADNLWRWITYDLDFGFSDVQHNTLTFALQNDGPFWPNPPESTYLLRKLMVNDEFRSIFINSFSDIFNTLWEEDRVHGIIDEMKNDISGEITNHLNRWNGGSYSIWESRINYLYTFASQRPAVVKEHLEQYFGLSNELTITLQVNDDDRGTIVLNTIEPEYYPWTGDYYQGVSLTAVAKAKKGFHFVMWTGATVSLKDTLVFHPKENATLKAIFAPNIDYTDQLVINEVFYENIADTISNDWVEIYNASDKFINLSGFILKDDNDKHQYIFPSNTLLGADNYLVVAANPEVFKTYYDTKDETVYGGFDFGFGNPEDCVRLYNQDEDLIDSIYYYFLNIESDSTFSYQRFVENEIEEWMPVEGMGTPFAKNEKTIENGTQTIANLNSYKVFPNPVSQSLTVAYSLASTSKVNIRLLDRSGKTVAILNESTQQKGSHRLVWNGATMLRQGMYILELETNQGQQHVKVVKL